jgi:bifunctional non-homologous end joining protein LigD
MLWDRGTWEPEVEDVGAALRKGDLKLRLDGYKLKGSWALVRTRGWGGRGRSPGAAPRDDGRSWLLIKHRDEWSGELDIAEFAPLSVKSGGDFEDILTADLPSFWTGNRAAARTTSLEASLAEIVAKVEKLQGRPIGAAPPEASPGRRRTRASARDERSR